MDGQLAAVLAAIGTDLAVIRSLVRVYLHVLPKGAAVHRLIVTGTTRETLVARVHLHDYSKQSYPIIIHNTSDRCNLKAWQT